MTITILEGERYLTASQEVPVIGRTYYLEDAETHTAPQRKAAHALIGEWFKSGLWDFVDTMDYERFRDAVKKKYGAGFSHLEYVDDRYNMVRVESVEEIPQSVLDSFNAGASGRIKGVLKSFTRYKKSEVKDLIDRLIDAMTERGVDTPKFRDIILGLEGANSDGELIDTQGFAV